MTEIVNKHWLTLLKLAFITIILLRVFSLDIFPVAPNDAVNYLNGTVSDKFLKNPLSILQIRAYRNAAGYPLYLSIWHHLAGTIPLDGLTLMAVSQRVLLAISLVALIWGLGPISAPLALYFSSGHFLAQSNILYAEGMTFPLSIILAVSMVKIYERRNSANVTSSWKFWLLISILASSYAFLMLAKINSVIVGLPLLVLALNIKRQGIRFKFSLTKTWLPITLIMLAAFSFVLQVSVDNYRVVGEFTPVYAKERFYFWGAWQQVFGEHPENQSRPELANYYGDGSPYTFLHGVEKAAGGYEEFQTTLPILSQGRSELLEISKVSIPYEVARTFGFGVLGGGKQELQWTRRKILDTNSRDTNTIQFWSGNGFVKANGFEEFLVKYNRGVEPLIIPGLMRRPMPVGNTYRYFQAIVSFVTILAILVLLALRKIKLVSLASLALVSYLVLVATTAFAFVDIWRYLVPSWAFLMVILFHGFIEVLRETENDTLRSYI